jgi:predicted GH43/DUF377 family glycosyl hydrolase
MSTQNHAVTGYQKNPILTRENIPYPVATVHNADIVQHDGYYIMLFRPHKLNRRSIIGRKDSNDCFSLTVSPTLFLTPATDSPFAEYEEFGVEDLRISPIKGEYLFIYSAYSIYGVRIALARTRDFETMAGFDPRPPL